MTYIEDQGWRPDGAKCIVSLDTEDLADYGFDTSNLTEEIWNDIVTRMRDYYESIQHALFECVGDLLPRTDD